MLSFVNCYLLVLIKITLSLLTFYSFMFLISQVVGFLLFISFSRKMPSLFGAAATVPFNGVNVTVSRTFTDPRQGGGRILCGLVQGCMSHVSFFEIGCVPIVVLHGGPSVPSNCTCLYPLMDQLGCGESSELQDVNA
mmetsp:Transcript_16134/g.22489  ORF Transcript_16134/g.22489 Transcript_16134/m.22489 type:complete len:137 (-) Transcript_16134:2321-2731(-)